MRIVLVVLLLGPLSPVSALDSTPGYTEVQRAFLREDFDSAVSLAQACILKDPEAAEAPRVWLWMALSLERLQRSNEALRELDRLKSRLHSRDPLWPELLFFDGEMSRRALQMPRAKAAYARLIERHPNSPWAPQAHLGLGMIDFHHQAYESALEHFRAAASQQAETATVRDAKLFEAICHLRLKHFQDADARVEALLSEAKDPGSVAQLAFYRGESRSGLARYDEAAADYRRAIEAAPSSTWVRAAQFGLGWVYAKAGRCEESVGAFATYLRDAQADYRVDALFAQGGCLLRLGREDEALARFDDIVSAAPDHRLALESAFILADSYRRQERFARAKELLHGFLRRALDPASLEQVRLRLGAIALEQGNDAQANAIFSLVERSDEPPLKQAALNGLGDVQLFLGDLPGAQRSYEQAIRLSASTVLGGYAAYQLGRMRLQSGALDEAIAIFRRLAAHPDPGLADDARLALVIAHINRKDLQAARSLLTEIRSSGGGTSSPVAARAGYYAALLALSDGDEPSARSLCEDVIARAPQTDESLEAHLLLADLRALADPPQDALAWLRRAYASERWSRSQRAKLAKRVGDVARNGALYAEAIRWYGQAVELLPSVAGEAGYRIASCYEEGGDLEPALRWYEAVSDPAWRVRGQLAAAKLLERQDRGAEARAIYERLAVESIPEAKLIQERLASFVSEGS